VVAILMAIGGYWWLLMAIIFVPIGDYSIVKHWCLFYWWLLMVIL
jgi:hypothetical protein